MHGDVVVSGCAALLVAVWVCMSADCHVGRHGMGRKMQMVVPWAVWVKQLELSQLRQLPLSYICFVEGLRSQLSLH